MNTHDCIVSGCKGAMYFGLNLTCQCCFGPIFMECYHTRHEVYDFLEAFGLTNQTIPIPTQQQIISKIKSSVFASGSVFEFICLKCKSKGNRFIVAAEQHNEHQLELQRVNNELKELNKIRTQITNKLTTETALTHELSNKLKQTELLHQQSMEKINEMNAEIHRLNMLNTDLQSQISNINSVQSYGSAAMDTNTSPSLSVSESMLQTYNEAICSTVNNRMNEIITRIENTLANHHTELVGQINGEESRKRKAPNGVNGSNIGAASVQYMAHLNSLNHTIINTVSSNELEPPVEKSKPKQVRSIHEIYVSKFKNDTTPEKIIEHVINKSTIKNRELFSVELLVRPGENVNKLSYVSFKITTCSESTYDAILKEDVWAPKFEAVPFSNQKSQIKSSKHDKNSHSQPQTPVRTKNNRNGNMNNSTHKRKVKFNVGNGGANQANVTPSSSKNNKNSSSNNNNNSSGHKTPKKTVISRHNMDAIRMHSNVTQQPAFLGLPGPSQIITQPMYHPSYQQHVPQQIPQQMALYHHQQQQHPQHFVVGQQPHQHPAQQTVWR